MEKIKTLTVCGPTASGKTALGVSLAKELNGEIVSADSIQIYKYIDIASAKPDENEMQGIKHYLLDFVDPNENYSVAQYVVDANRAIDEIVSKKKMPVIVGGTGLYIDSLINNISFLDNGLDDSVRKKLKQRLENEGSKTLYDELFEIDKKAAEKIHPNNSVKILRALEVYYSSGMTLTKQNELSRAVESRFDNTTVFLNCKNRDYLYDRINRRVDLMMQKGLLREAENYYKNFYSSTSSQAIGYKELKPYLDGNLSLEKCVENLKKATRNYAKRQLTWFRRNELSHTLYIDEYNSIQQLTQEVINIFRREND